MAEGRRDIASLVALAGVVAIIVVIGFLPRKAPKVTTKWEGLVFVVGGKASFDGKRMSLIGGRAFLVDKEERWLSQEWNPADRIRADEDTQERGHYLLTDVDRQQVVGATELPIRCADDLLNCDIPNAEPTHQPGSGVIWKWSGKWIASCV